VDRGPEAPPPHPPEIGVSAQEAEERSGRDIVGGRSWHYLGRRAPLRPPAPGALVAGGSILEDETERGGSIPFAE